MGAINISDADPDTQGLINYLQGASQISRDNIFLRELGDAATLKRKLLALLEDLSKAQAISMVVQWVEGFKRSHPQPSTVVHELRILPATPAKVETEPSDLAPFFGDRETANTIRRSQTLSERKRWTAYFNRFGCLICGKTDVAYASEGMCHNCRMRTYGRLKRLRGSLPVVRANVMRKPRKKDSVLIA